MTRTSLIHLAVLLLLAPLALAQEGASGDAAEAALRVKVYRNWSIRLPAESWKPVGKKFAFADGLGADFKAVLEGRDLAIDVDADGKVDVKVEQPGGHVILVNGDRRHALRVNLVEGEWRYAPACVLKGEVAGTQVRIIDQNNNGSFDDIGEDAIVVGKGKVASFLSKVITIDGKLHEIDVDSKSMTLSHRPYAGPVAELELSTVTRGKVMAAVVKSSDGQHSFGFSGHGASMKVPAGDYNLHSGTISFGGNTVKVKQGRAAALSLPAEGKGKMEFGGPVAAEFLYNKKGRELEFSPDHIFFYGKMGEQYHGWNPLGESPRITVVTKSGREIAEAYFPGSC